MFHHEIYAEPLNNGEPDLVGLVKAYLLGTHIADKESRLAVLEASPELYQQTDSHPDGSAIRLAHERTSPGPSSLFRFIW
jgi:hypothetical protein